MYSHISGVNLVIGQNDMLWDENGKDYIDFTSGIFCVNIGYSNPYIIEAYEKHTHPGRLQHVYTFGHESRDKYLEQLCRFTGYPYAYLFSAGTEATEAAWRVMSKVSGQEYILGMGQENNAFHGKTLGARIMAGAHPSHLYGQPAETSCGIIMEPYNPLYAKLHSMQQIERIEKMIDDYQLTLCIDEIQAGFGRTGKVFGHEHYETLPAPDFVCIGKGMGNGYPIAALLSCDDLDDPAFELSSTHGGDPLACEVGSAVINYFEDNRIIEEAAHKGTILQRKLHELPIESHGLGLVAALVFQSPEQASAAVGEAANKGLLLVHTNHATAKIGPPLTITTENLLTGCEILKEVCDGD